MSDRQAIERLIEAVEAGDDNLDYEDFGILNHDGTVSGEIEALGAYGGSLNSAKALHDALLPGWEYLVGISNARVWLPNGKEGAPDVSGMSAVASRAWLLAILRAVHQRGTT